MRTLVFAVAALVVASSCGTPPCSTQGTGTISIVFEGVPAGAKARATLDGSKPELIEEAKTLTVNAGTWTLTGEKLTIADPLVRTVYSPPPSISICVVQGATQTFTIGWSKVSSSNRLFVANGSGGTGNLHAFDSASLAATGSVASSWNQEGPGSGSVAFDKAGNLWALGATVSDPHIVRYSATSFASQTKAVADRQLNVMGVACIPGATSLAFDKEGNLYMGSACMKQVYKLPASSFTNLSAASTPIAPVLTLSGFMGVEGLAFDKDGNLYVADPGAREVARFDAASLTGMSAAPSGRFRAKASDQPADTSVLGVSALAFDKDGNLFAFDFGSSNVVYWYPAAQLTGTATKTVLPGARMTVSVAGIPEGMAFDESGGLWMPLRQGTVVRFSPAQLVVSSGAGAPTQPERVITGTSLGYAAYPAFYPAPAALPLFHALP